MGEPVMATAGLRPATTAFALLLSAGCGSAYHASPEEATSPHLSAAIDSAILHLMALDLSPGVGIVVVSDKQVVHLKGYGYADVEEKRPFTSETAFYIASTTKSFTGLAAAMLDREGAFMLDAPVSRYLPQLRLREPLKPDSISIRSLLTHTHGIGNAGPVTARLAYTGLFNGNEELIKLLSEHQQAQTGRQYAYGNIGYNVAALAMDAALKESWKETLERLIFAPLGMTSTSAYVSRYPRERLAMPYQLTLPGFTRRYYGKTDSNMQSAGGLITTPSDMGRWLQAHINQGRHDGKQVLPAEAIAESHRLLARTDANVRGARQIGYGLGWQIFLVDGDTLLMHGGGFPGFSTHMSFMPTKRVGVAVMANNSELGGGLTEFAAREIYRILLGVGPPRPASLAAVREQASRARAGVIADLTRRAARPQTLDFPLEAYTGSFENPLLGRLDLQLVNGKLEARLGVAWSRVEVYDKTKNQLRVEIFGDGDVVNVKMREGKVQAVTFSGATFSRVE